MDFKRPKRMDAAAAAAAAGPHLAANLNFCQYL